MQELVNVLERIAESLDNINKTLDVYVRDELEFKEGIKNSIVGIDSEMLNIRSTLQERM